MGRWYWNDYTPTSPRQTKGGIKAHSKRGAFGQSWWAKKWIEVLERFTDPKRLGRGRNYARRGQVTSIDIKKGTVKAKVQGSRARAYSVTIGIKPLSKEDWTLVLKALSQRTIFAASLLAGEMPQDIDDVFADAGLSMFPKTGRDVDTDCSCPDWSNPCKHIAAVHYLLGEEFDRDPFLLFRLRGLSRAELLRRIGGTAGRAARKSEPTTSPIPPEPLPADPEMFWTKFEPDESLCREIDTPTIPAALPKRLGAFPFWRGDQRFLDVMERVYSEASGAAVKILIGDTAQEDRSL